MPQIHWEELSMSPRRIVILALAIFALTASVAIAAESQKFRGHTEGLFFTTAGQDGHYRQAKIGFTKIGNRLTNFRWEIRVECSDDTHKSFVIKPSGFLTLDDEGRFAGRVTQANGSFDRISGRIRGERASGAVRKVITGTPSCNSGRVDFKAHETD
jgi:hypothetical protein